MSTNTFMSLAKAIVLLALTALMVSLVVMSVQATLKPNPDYESCLAKARTVNSVDELPVICLQWFGK